MTVVVANEQLEMYPDIVWKRISEAVNISGVHPNLDKFKRMRYNTQSNKGVHQTQSSSEFVKGRYNISNYRGLLDETRNILSKCWMDDCVWVSNLTKFVYPSCSQDPRLSRTSYIY